MVSRPPDDSYLFPSRSFVRNLSQRVSQQQYDIWFRGTRFDFAPPNRLVVTVPTRFHKKWLESNYLDTILLSARSVFTFEPEVAFHLSERAASEERGEDGRPPLGDVLHRFQRGDIPRQRGSRRARLGLDARERLAGTPGPGARDTSLNSPINSGYTFARFLVGPSNRVAHAATLTVSESPSTLYNPLLVWGDTGLGKSHLLQAAHHEMLHHKRVRPLYLTSNDFIHHCLAARSEEDRNAFQERMERFDVVMLDDIHELTADGGHQNAFARLLQHFLQDDRRIILSSSRAPWDLEGLPEAIVVRLKRGLICTLDTPGRDLRAELFRVCAARHAIDLSPDVAAALARGYPGNPREIQGIVQQLVARNSLLSEGLKTIRSLPDTALDPSQILVSERHTIELDDILHVVGSYFGKKSSEVISSSREKSIVRARQVAMYLARELTAHSFVEIGSFFGGRDHATAIHAVNRIRKLEAEEPNLKRDLLTIRDHLETS